MFFPYNINLMNRRFSVIGSIPFILILFAFMAFGFYIYRDPRFILFAIGGTIFTIVTDWYNHKRAFSHPKSKTKKYQSEINFLKASYPLGATVEDEYLLIRGLVRMQTTHYDSTCSQDYYTERKIYYTDIENFCKNKVTCYIDFVDTHKFSNPADERLFLSDYFENYDELFKILKHKCYDK
ncbi:MAG: hypothetical protein ACRC1T_03015 [Clostridium chrysemydis]|uniref:hypothetical protein n=1 Tax=Clostridium chrysemydis TaxID=2665504 RepID=UPI003F2E44BE